MLFENGAARRTIAALNASNAGIRLTIPEAYAVHKAVIAWDSATSEDRLPDASLGAGPFLLATMRFAMASWPRVHFLNRAAGGTLLPRLLLDIIPGVFCSAHFALIAPAEPVRAGDHVAAGRAVQRLWLAATAAGLKGIATGAGYLGEFLALPPAENAGAILAAISCGAVFMGANTYIGNGPNFMVKAIAEQNNIRMPGFFGYMLYSTLILLPLFGLVTLIFFR